MAQWVGVGWSNGKRKGSTTHGWPEWGKVGGEMGGKKQPLGKKKWKNTLREGEDHPLLFLDKAKGGRSRITVCGGKN